MNFEVLAGFFRSSLSGITVYIDINSTTSPDVNALSNLFVYWSNMSISIVVPCSGTSGSTLYTNVVKSLFIISVVAPERCFSSFNTAIICLNNITVLAV